MRYLALVVVLLLPASALAQGSAPDPLQDAVTTAYRQGFVLGQAVAQQRAQQEIVDLRAQLDKATKPPHPAEPGK